MDWINVDDYVFLSGLGWVKVSSIIAPTTSKPYYIAKLATTNTVGYTEGQVIKITTIYNIIDFDRYEFQVDMSTRQGSYYIVVNGTDSNFVAKEFISEWINVQTVHKKHHLIEWYATKNNEINYATGISFSMRLPYLLDLKWSPSTEQDIYITDTNTINLDSKVREFYELSLLPLPTAMAQKLVLVLAHNRIFINGVSYLLEGEPESERVGSTNLYSFRANLVKTNYVFDSTQGTTAGEILLGSGVPLAIDSNAKGLLWIR